MQETLNFYKKQIDQLTQELSAINRTILWVRILRLLVFTSTALLTYITFYQKKPPFFIIVLGFLVFVFLIVKHQDLKEKRGILLSKISTNNLEINVINGRFTNLPDGSEFADPLHFYSQDIDLFGKGSFFQYLNRTVTHHGKATLANILCSNTITHVEEKQHALQELSKKVLWRHHFSALANSVANTNTQTTQIISWITGYTNKIPPFLTYLTPLFSAISIGIITLLILKIIPFVVFTLWFFIGLIITGIYLKKTSSIYTSAGNAKAIFKQYYLLLEHIENGKFESEILVEKQQNIAVKNQKASSIFKKFSRILDAFDQRNNIVIAVVGNALFLWDIVNANKAEKWISNYKQVVQQWFDVVAFFDANTSLSNFVFNHPDYAFPVIQKNENGINAKNLGHPLLNSTKRIDNDFLIGKDQFFIITGANMAGKSTFLRTVSLSIIMANCGLPVCAESYSYTPIKLITSMRTSDSLSDDESYFYSELKRLKFIVDAIKTDTYFIILDEILKGTNSKDKAVGSKQFVEKLTLSKSTGIIATHDISLCELAEKHLQILNYYFDAEIVNNELFFDYTLKTGICKNMNASFLLKKMEIV